MKLCEYCMAEFEPKRPDQKYCRPKCAKRYAQFKNFKKAGRIVYTRICPKCGRLFMTIDERKVDCQDCIGNEVKERLRKPKKKDDAMPSADSIITIWFKLLILAGKQNNNGVFMMSNKLPFTDEMLATIFRRDLNTVRLALKTFEEFGMIEVVDNVITIPNWNKHQTLDAYEKKKERDRLYQQNRRKKQKNLIEQKSPDKSSDVAVSDKEEEKEEDKEKENIKENSLSTDSGDLFDFDDAWKKTFNIYPKKTAYSTSKTAWMDKVLEVIEENQPDIVIVFVKLKPDKFMICVITSYQATRTAYMSVKNNISVFCVSA